VKREEAGELWEKFISHLHEVQPLGKKDKVEPHTNFVGSVNSYKKIFLDALEKEDDGGK
jgi:hypothetical protein